MEYMKADVGFVSAFVPIVVGRSDLDGPHDVVSVSFMSGCGSC